MKATTITLAVLFGLLLAIPATADENERDTLKKELAALQQKLKARYPTLSKLIDDEKVGWTFRGEVEAVKAATLNEKLEGEKTVKVFLEEENRYRSRVYDLIAKLSGTTREKVVERAWNQRIKKAEPEHYLMPKADTWVKKKDYKPDPEESGLP